jgi:hypothetical protein
MSIANTDNLKALNEQLKGISDFLAEVSEDMIEGGFTQIPIFVAHQEQAKIGEMIIDRTEFGYAFSINATFSLSYSLYLFSRSDLLKKFKS